MFHTQKDFDTTGWNPERYGSIVTLYVFYLNLFCSYFYLYPELTTVNRSVKSPRHFKNNVENRQKKCFGRCVSRSCDWLVMKM